MDLKDKLIASYASLEEQEGTDRHKRMRQEAFKNFEAKGFPTKKEEAWKYTSLRPVLKHDYNISPQTKNGVDYKAVEDYFINDLDAYTLAFVDGVYAPHLSTPAEGDVDVCTLSTALKADKYNAIIEEHFNKVAPKEDSLSSLNTAFYNEGAFIYIKKNGLADKPVQLMYFSTGSEKAMFIQPRNLVVAGENAQVKIIERHQSLTDNPVLTNTVTEIVAEKRALVDYYKIQNDKTTASLIDNTHLAQGSESDCAIHTFSFGGKLTRNNLKSTQKGERINTTFKGVTIIEDKQHVDHNTFVHHTQPNCESHQDYKGVFDDKAHGVFDGYILVDKIAQQTDGYQKSDNLLMSDKATAHAKPQLEIYADDVICSHGCTIGQIDKEALFYLKSRGIPEKEAKALMMYAFSNKVLNSVKIPELKRRINEQIALKLGVNLGFDDL